MRPWPPTRPRWSILWLLWDMHENIRHIKEKQECFMTETQDRLDALNTKLQQVQEANAASAAGIRSDVGDLKAQIEDLKTQVANGQAPDFTAIEATADSLVAGAESLAALDAENPEQPPVEPTE